MGHLKEANIPAFATAVQVASSGGREKLEELMGLDEVFMKMNHAGEAELSVGSSKVNFDITGEAAQPTEEGVCVKDQPRSDDRSLNTSLPKDREGMTMRQMAESGDKIERASS